MEEVFESPSSDLEQITESEPSAVSEASKRGDPENPYRVLKGTVKGIDVLRRVVAVGEIIVVTRKAGEAPKRH